MKFKKKPVIIEVFQMTKEFKENYIHVNQIFLNKLMKGYQNKL